MDVMLTYAPPTTSDATLQARILRTEKFAIIGGTLGALTILLLNASGRRKEAFVLTACGIVGGGVLGWVRLKQRFPNG